MEDTPVWELASKPCGEHHYLENLSSNAGDISGDIACFIIICMYTY